jgi:hypothetical protein
MAMNLELRNIPTTLEVYWITLGELFQWFGESVSHSAVLNEVHY